MENNQSLIPDEMLFLDLSGNTGIIIGEVMLAPPIAAYPFLAQPVVSFLYPSL